MNLNLASMNVGFDSIDSNMDSIVSNLVSGNTASALDNSQDGRMGNDIRPGEKRGPVYPKRGPCPGVDLVFRDYVGGQQTVSPHMWGRHLQSPAIPGRGPVSPELRRGHLSGPWQFASHHRIIGGSGRLWLRCGPCVAKLFAVHPRSL